MSKGHTEKTTDFWGNEKEEHFDSSGRKIGETKFETDWFGNPKQEHFNLDGDKIGETKHGTDFWGQDRAEHFDSFGKMIGTSKDEDTFFGGKEQRHYDSSGRKVGVTRSESQLFGGPKKVHEGQYFKARPEGEGSSETTSSGASEAGYYYDSPSGSQVGISRQEEGLCGGHKEVHKDADDGLRALVSFTLLMLLILIVVLISLILGEFLSHLSKWLI